MRLTPGEFMKQPSVVKKEPVHVNAHFSDQIFVDNPQSELNVSV